ncbi:sporulation protein YunB [Heliomicrobium modesticaldum]|uniref:sporulation protein YunB n=1 Tax=Heliomicrobium modesticaldum TaxID=35701 RepID=UPI000674075C|nr:sporulation protein YunB [Heliomicrobium modesticaldum]
MFWLRWRLRWERWTRQGSPAFWLAPVSFLLLCLFLFTLAEINMKNTILAVAENQGKVIATEAIHESILRRVVNDASFRDLIFYKTDQEGRIVLLQPNTLRINQLAAETAIDVQQTLSNLNEKDIQIPLGQMTGVRLLAGWGPLLHVRMLPIGNVKVEPVESFEEAGINQTKHMIYLHVEASIRILIPLVSSEIPVSTRIPIATTIISGAVPNVYLRGESAMHPSLDLKNDS